MHFSNATKTLLALSALTLVTGLAVIPEIYLAPPAADELTWGARSLVPWWFPEERILSRADWPDGYQRKYYFCIHHPSFARIVYRTALHAAGYYDPPAEAWDYNRGYEANLAHGRALPTGFRRTLRYVNAAFFLAAVFLAYLALNRALANRFLAAVGASALAVEPTVTTGWKAVVPYIGTDAIFLFWLVFFWYAWLVLKDRGLRAVLILGVIGGLATATKINGAFVLAGAAVFYCVSSRGWARLARPAALLAVSVCVFFALNPIYFGGGFAWTRTVLRDMLRLMFWLKDTTTATSWGTYSRLETVMGALPHLVFIVPIAAAVLAARRRRWFAVTFYWSMSVILCNLALIYMPQPRYAAPVRAALLLLVMASGLSQAACIWRTRSAAAPVPQPADACLSEPT